MTARVDAQIQQPASHQRTDPASRPGAFARAFENALRGMDRTATMSPGGATVEIDARSAIELQAAVYRDAERLELASKLLDHGVGAVKTILQTRV